MSLIERRSSRRYDQFVWGILLLVLLLATSTPANGQAVRWGATAGVATMTGGGDGLGDVDRSTGMVVGGSATMEVVGPLAIRPELRYIQKGWTFDGRTANGESFTSIVNLDYLELPVLAVARVPVAPFLSVGAVAGPTLGVRVNSSVDIEGPEPPQRTDPDDRIERTEVGATAGVQVAVGLQDTRIRLEGRYLRSLTNVNNQRIVEPDGSRGPPPTIRNQGWSVVLGVAF